MQAGYQIVDIELDGDHGDHGWVGGGALVLARRGGVPVGSRLFDERPPPDRRLADLIVTRHDEPPGPVGRPASITVAVCTKDRPALLDRCLESIDGAIAAAGAEADVDVLVVDNASSDEDTRRVAEARGARVVREDVPGLDFA